MIQLVLVMLLDVVLERHSLLVVVMLVKADPVRWYAVHHKLGRSNLNSKLELDLEPHLRLDLDQHWNKHLNLDGSLDENLGLKLAWGLERLLVQELGRNLEQILELDLERDLDQDLGWNLVQDLDHELEWELGRSTILRIVSTVASIGKKRSSFSSKVEAKK